MASETNSKCSGPVLMIRLAKVSKPKLSEPMLRACTRATESDTVVNNFIAKECSVDSECVKGTEV